MARGDRQAWKQAARYTIALLSCLADGTIQPMVYAAVALGVISLAGLEMARSVSAILKKPARNAFPRDEIRGRKYAREAVFRVPRFLFT